MRDPKRIRAFCNRLAAAWETNPDFRFGQLVVNVFGLMYKDPFYAEDDEMIELIEKYMAYLDHNVKPKEEEGEQNE